MKLILILFMGLTISAQAQKNESPEKQDNNMFFTKEVNGTMQEVMHKVKELLKAEKFGVITEIDMDKTLKEKIGVEMQPYKILGVCNPGFAHEALQTEPDIGVFLPCKVVLNQINENTIRVVSANPDAMMRMLGNNELNKTAAEVANKLEKVIMSL